MKIFSKIHNYQKTISFALQTEGKNKAIIVWFFQLIHWYSQNTGGIIEFFLLKLHKRGYRKKDYLTENQFIKVHHELNRAYYRILLENKYVFDRYLTSEGFTLAPMIGFIEHDRVHFSGKDKMIELHELLEKDLSCFCKMNTSCGGKEVFKLDIKDHNLFINNKPSTIDNLRKRIAKEVHVLQETIYQHSALNDINPNCVNTLRIITVDSGKETTVFTSVLRIGVGNSVVDNTAQGNLVCGIHPDGSLFREAADQSRVEKWITQHPDTGFKFEGFSVPFYNEALKLCTDLHKAFNCFFIIGWDIAITENGPVAIEGNPLNDLLWLQVIYGPLKTKFLDCATSYKKEFPDRK